MQIVEAAEVALPQGQVEEHRHAAHALDTAADGEREVARGHRLRSGMGGELAGAAHAVHRHARHLGRQAGDVVWERSLFYDGTTMTSPAPGIIDMTGPARCLYYGPYLHLPVGVWEGHLYLGCSDQVTDTRLRVDVYSDAVDAVFLTRLTKGGIFRMPLSFAVTDSRNPLQVRIFIDRGEIDGLFAFKQVILRRRPAVPAPETSQLIGSNEGRA